MLAAGLAEASRACTALRGLAQPHASICAPQEKAGVAHAGPKAPAHAPLRKRKVGVSTVLFAVCVACDSNCSVLRASLLRSLKLLPFRSPQADRGPKDAYEVQEPNDEGEMPAEGQMVGCQSCMGSHPSLPPHLPRPTLRITSPFPTQVPYTKTQQVAMSMGGSFMESMAPAMGAMVQSAAMQLQTTNMAAQHNMKMEAAEMEMKQTKQLADMVKVGPAAAWAWCRHPLSDFSVPTPPTGSDQQRCGPLHHPGDGVQGPGLCGGRRAHPQRQP